MQKEETKKREGGGDVGGAEMRRVGGGTCVASARENQLGYMASVWLGFRVYNSWALID